MSINLISLKCPECSSQLNVEDNMPHVFCMYCGTKILVSNQNEYIVRHIDEAGVRHADTDRIIKLKQMEYEEKRRESEEKQKNRRLILSLSIGAIGILMIIIGYALGALTHDPDSPLYVIAMVGMIVIEAAFFVAMSGDSNKQK